MPHTAGRPLDLFQAVVKSDRPRGLIELADATDIDKSTAARLLDLLVKCYLVSRGELTRRYADGPEFLAMRLSFTSRADVRRVAGPHLTALRDASGERVSLQLKAGGRRVCIAVNRSPRTSPRNAYETSDRRWVALPGGTQQVVNRNLSVIGHPELADGARFSTPLARRDHAEELDTLVASWIQAHPLDEVLTVFSNAQAPISPVYDLAQLVADPHYLARESIIAIPDADLGEIHMQNVVPRLSRTPGQIRRGGKTAVGAGMGPIADWLGSDVELPLPRAIDESLEQREVPGI